MEEQKTNISSPAITGQTTAEQGYQKKYDPAAAEQKYQKRLLEVKNLLARYTTEADKGDFYKRNKQAIEDLTRSSFSTSSVSNVMTGFRAYANPNKTYDARIELLYYKNKDDQWALSYTPRLHFRNEKELIIHPTLNLPTGVKEEFFFSLNECKQNKLETLLNIGGENIKIALNEAELTELSATRQLSRTIKSSNESKYEYWISAGSEPGKREVNRLIVTQKEKAQLTVADIEQLQQTGRLNRPVAVGEGINERKYFVAVDKELNKFAIVPTSVFSRLDMVKNISLSQFDITNLLAGQQITTTMMKGKDAGARVTAYLDPVKKTIKIETPEQQQRPEQKVKQKATMSNDLKTALQKTAVVEKQEPAVAQHQKMGV